MFFKRIKRIGRETIQTLHFLLTYQIHILSSHVILSRVRKTDILLTLFPAITIGCSSDVPASDQKPYSCNFTQIMISSSFLSVSKSDGGTLNILTFENNRLRRLDTHQKFDNYQGSQVFPASTGGDKLFFFCLNLNSDVGKWSKIYSYNSLSGMTCDLEDECPDAPIMTGECICEAGSATSVDLKPLACQVCLESIACDFSGTPYSSEKLHEVKVYLINVNASCSLNGNNSGSNIRIINRGMLNKLDIQGFKDKSIIVCEIEGTIGKKKIKPGCRFMCYPFSGDKGLCTRLVIEGKVGSNVYYWPVNIDNLEKGTGYSYKILIRRKGVSDPDIAISPVNLEFKTAITPWREKEDYSVAF